MKRDWTFIAAVAALAVVAVVRVASTHRVFAATLDEPIHLAAGYEWFTGKYEIDVTHPPLARILAALPLYVSGYPEPAPTNMIDRGNQLLYHGNRYEKTLARARIGNLVLLIAAIVTVAVWARRTFGRGVAILATALFTSVPAVLGHAGLVTTDLSVAAMLPLALLALSVILSEAKDLPRHHGEDPSPSSRLRMTRRALFLGIAVGLGVLSKLSFLVYFIPCAIVLLAMRWRPRVNVRATAIVLAAAFVVAWAGYRFDVQRPASIMKEAPDFFAAAGIPRALANVPLPAPALPLGFAQVRLHDRGGHTAFLLGETSRTGWWYYFPVVFFYKTPLPLLILFAWGAWHRRALELVLIALAIMVMAMTASLNIGLRHILPIYAPVAIVAAHGAAEIWRRGRDLFPRAALGALLAWMFAGVAVQHPDYLAWFNELAHPNPARIAVDSNLDWGQDVLRLARHVRTQRPEPFYYVMNNSTRLAAHGVGGEWLPPYRQVSGWIAVGENWLAFSGDEYAWLKAYRPARRIGKSIRLYYVPPM
ncbi:MAG TPA: phospholipid carrier-dependent glycosyltransferase [Thermoanaerobaculia bacterium]|nr:phospholipid carrier-dependent glycosyltransferase [Thermoanaerobaculia bacterium]